jgi:hypothetical protein
MLIRIRKIDFRLAGIKERARMYPIFRTLSKESENRKKGRTAARPFFFANASKIGTIPS